MIARLTDKNQLTIPDPLIFDLPDSEFFDITCEDGRIVLTPVTVAEINRRGDEVQRKLQERGITEKDVADAIKWARPYSQFPSLRQASLEN